MLELHVADTTVNSSRIALSWCISKELGEQILKTNQEANLLLVVRNEEGTTEVRKIVPLTDLLTYIDFKSPGNNIVFGRIILGRTLNSLKNLYLEIYQRTYNTRIYDYEGTVYPRDILGDHTPINISDVNLNVVVPKEVFAKEPPEWEKKWVNRLFYGKAFDQCNFRRRRLFAYTIQPILWILAFIGHTLFTSILRLATVSDINNDWMRDPFTALNNDVGYHSSVRIIPNSIKQLFSEGPLFNKGLLAPLFFAVSPILLIGSTLILKLCKFTWINAMLLAPLANIVFVISLLIFGLFLASLIWLFQDFKWFKLILKGLDKLFASKNPEGYLNDELVDNLTCSGNPKFIVSELPKKARTVKLRFEEFKTKVCRPFSG